MSDRFFLLSPPHAGRALLEGDEARHLVRVLRGKVGDLVRVFDGSGVEWPARVMTIGRDEVTLELGEPLVAAVAITPPLTLAVALPKGDRQKWLVEKLTELGVARLVPLVTLRGVAEATPAAAHRLRRGVLEACKQSGRNTLMEIGEPQTIAEILRERPAAASMLVADPGAPPLAASSPATAGRTVLGFVGPEGGFTADELALLAAAGVERIGLGPHILRVETAAIALAARLA